MQITKAGKSKKVYLLTEHFSSCKKKKDEKEEEENKCTDERSK